MAEGFKIGQIIIGMIVIGAVLTSVLLLTTDIASKNDLEFSNSTIEKYNNYEEMVNLTNTLKKNESAMQTKGGIMDILGDWFEQGYTTLRASKIAAEGADDILQAAGEEAGMGQIGKVMTGAFITIIFLIFIFIIISTLTNREQI